MKTVIIDYGLGNLRSVYKACKRIGVTPIVTRDSRELYLADKLILPGVGNFAKGMKNLREMGILEQIETLVIQKEIPILGICLGMQLMTTHSEEGDCDGLCWIEAITTRFVRNELKVPHMGWNTLNSVNISPLMDNIKTNDFFYFVHSYFVTCKNQRDVITETYYGQNFVSAFSRGNIYGVQFHPEKSHDAGIELLHNFIKIV